MLIQKRPLQAIFCQAFLIAACLAPLFFYKISILFCVFSFIKILILHKTQCRISNSKQQKYVIMMMMNKKESSNWPDEATTYYWLNIVLFLNYLITPRLDVGNFSCNSWQPMALCFQCYLLIFFSLLYKIYKKIVPLFLLPAFFAQNH